MAGAPKASATRGGYGLVPGAETPPYHYNYVTPGMKTGVPRVDTAPHDVGTPISLNDR